MPKISAANRSGFPGVSWNARAKQWVLTFRREYQGSFVTPEEASAKYQALSAKYQASQPPRAPTTFKERTLHAIRQGIRFKYRALQAPYKDAPNSPERNKLYARMQEELLNSEQVYLMQFVDDPEPRAESYGHSSAYLGDLLLWKQRQLTKKEA